jgi:hypothetical protein
MIDARWPIAIPHRLSGISHQASIIGLRLSGIPIVPAARP